MQNKRPDTLIFSLMFSLTKILTFGWISGCKKILWIRNRDLCDCPKGPRFTLWYDVYNSYFNKM